MTYPAWPDAEEIKRIHESGSARRRKREYIKKGYTWQLSIYGVITDKETKTANYCRIEVLSNTPYNYRRTALIYDFFKELKPLTTYSIWIYDKDRDALRCVGQYR